MKLLIDFLPVLLFFLTFKLAGLDKDAAARFATEHLGAAVSGGTVGPEEAPVLLATVVVILATALQVAWIKSRGQRVAPMLWVSLVLVTLLGGATVWFHSETFIKWKPSILYWAMGLTLWLSRLVFRRNLVRSMLGSQIDVPDRIWHRLNFAWVAFFGMMGLLNVWVAYSYSTATWVNFKLFGGMGLMFAFTMAQALYLAPHAREADDGKGSPP